MTGPVHGLPAAVQFLTRVPVRLRDEPAMAKAIPWFPVVGAAVGAVVGGVAAGLWYWLPPLLAASVGVLVGVLVTGAFHEDGLADVADAFAGGWTVERRLEILKDPRHGSYGVAALSGSIVLRVVALGSMVGPAAMFAAAVAAHALGRAAAVVVMRLARPARSGGLGAGHVLAVGRGGAMAGALAALAIAGLAVGWWVLPLAGAAVAGAAAVTWLAVRKIGGVSGDVFGAIEQVVECLCLVVTSGLALHHPLWWA